VTQGTEENYLALLVCIIKKKSVNKALQDMFGAVEQEIKTKQMPDTELSRKIQEMRQLRKDGKKYSEISKKYGLPLGTVYYHINGKTRKPKK